MASGFLLLRHSSSSPLTLENVILDMRTFDYVMIFTVYGKKITSQGSKSKFFLPNMVKRLRHRGQIIT